MPYEAVIGLEVHAQLLTQSKIFCTCSTRFGIEPNANTCPVCLGLPGVLPVLNQQAVAFAIRAGLALHCKIAPESVFARKNYFYPDLPKGYQISQYEVPLCSGGYLDIPTEEGTKRIGLTRIHMEEDAGKLLHEHPSTRSTEASWVDLNRAGVPLIEIVSEPDMRSPAEAVSYLKALRNILRYLEICDGNMEEGSLRCDANISLRLVGSEKFGTKAELKNMNSFKHVERALNYEIERQTEVLEQGGTLVQETRLWDVERALTEAMRSKEEAHDYRYFPDPDLPQLKVSPAWIAEIAQVLPELPLAKRDRFLADYGLSEVDAETLTQSKSLAEFFEAAVKLYKKDPKKVANWIQTELLRELNQEGIEITAAKITPSHLAELLQLIDAGTISGKIAKEIFVKVYQSGRNPKAIVAEAGVQQVSDAGTLEPIIAELIAAHPKEVERYRGGQAQLIGFFVGQLMQATHGQANPKLVNELLRKKLETS